MKAIIPYQRAAFFTVLLVAGIFCLTNCFNAEEEKKPAPAAAGKKLFAGSASCATCHAAISATHVNTAHFHTSEMAAATNIKGSFDSGKNTFSFSNGSLVKMEKRNGGFYQSAIYNGIEKKSQRFDIIFGSGTKGQSYTAWVGNVLVQLPITYFTATDQWSNSPGYPNEISLNRVVTSRCLECHTTYMEKTSAEAAEPERFNKASMVLGVDCEKCHGPAVDHVAFQTAHPEEKKASFIINPASFTRAQSLDMCALCHGGRLQKTSPSFSFAAGDKLSDYFAIDTAGKDPNDIDVHGNQYGLLAASKCFLKSNSLTCTTCHNPHENEKGKAASFSQKCISCHSSKQPAAVTCKLTPALGNAIAANCTNCHMPELPSKSIAVLLQGKEQLTSATMHTHFIKAYPEVTEKIAAFLKSGAGHHNKK